MKKYPDIQVGDKLNYLTVIGEGDPYIWTNSKTGKTKKQKRWLCQCDCGNIISVTQNDLRSGHTKSCGCYNRKATSERNKANRKQNSYLIKEDMIIGFTLKGEPFYLDKDDFDKVKDYCWHYNQAGYIETSTNPGRIFMHRLLTNCPEDKFVDHINHNIHDNRKENLRIVSCSQNNMNACLRSDNSSGYSGISYRPEFNRYQVTISINEKSQYLGSFENFEDALEVRKEAEEKYYGEYAYDLNNDYRYSNSV